MAEKATPRSVADEREVPRFASIIGLGFGDCGKGLFTDFLTRRWKAHTVVRFNGGAQAGHNVVTPDGRHHTFSQFAAGSFVPGTLTVLSEPVVVHPTALLVENEYLKRVGIGDGLDRIRIDARCRVTTPFHQAAGRLREWNRGRARHGSCGVGVGETVKYSIEHPDSTLRYADLTRDSHAIDKLHEIQRNLLAEFGAHPEPEEAEPRRDFELLHDKNMAREWMDQCRVLISAVAPASHAALSQRIHKPGCVLFEGAQGILLDEWRGFHPYTSWSSVGGNALDALAASWELPEAIQHFGVLRSYLTRHGPGPMPSYDPALSSFPEPHNANNDWQGPFFRGHPDEVLLRYALACAGSLTGLLISHLDIFENGKSLRWCEGYRTPVEAIDEALCERRDDGVVTSLKVPAILILEHQARLTRLLEQSDAVYASKRIDAAPQFLERLGDVSGLPVCFAAYGNTAERVGPPIV